jgi:alpha-beta hydrolase superfamily lysophospholipase
LREPAIHTHTASDGYRWKYRHYESPSAPRANIVCIHGIQSHGGWYEHSCRRLAEAGFAVSFLDRRGSGLNEQDRGDAPSFRRLLDDIAEYLVILRDTGGEEQRGRRGHGTDHSLPVSPSPRLPRFLVAISWGGKLALALQRRHPGLVDGLALLCPGIVSQVRTSLRERLGIARAYLLSPGRLFPVPLNDPELFTASPEWQQFLRDDPLSVRQATARFLAHSVRLDGYLRFVRRYVTVPVLLLLAGHDRIVDNAGTRRFAESLASRDRTIIEYPEAHHTLEFEARPHRYLDDLIGWLDQQSANARPEAARDDAR